MAPSWTNTGLITPELTIFANVEPQPASVVARDVITLFADSHRDGQVIYTSAGSSGEVEQLLLEAAATILPNPSGKSYTEECGIMLEGSQRTQATAQDDLSKPMEDA